MSTDPKSVVMAWTDALNQHDPDAVASLFSADAVLTDVGTGQRAEGIDEIRECAVAFIGTFTDLQIEKTNFLVAEGHHATEWIMTRIHTGDVPGLSATGHSFRIVGAGVGEVRDSKIVNATEFWNMADFLIQVGVLRPSGGLRRPDRPNGE